MKEAGKKFEWRPGAFALSSKRGEHVSAPVKLLQAGKLLDKVMTPAADEIEGRPKQEVYAATLETHEELLAAADTVNEDALPKLARELRESGTYQMLLQVYLFDLLFQLYLWRLESLPRPNKLPKDRPWILVEEQGGEPVATVSYDRREVEDLEEIMARIRGLFAPALEDDAFWLELARQVWTHLAAWTLRDLKREMGPETLQNMLDEEFDQLFWERMEPEALQYYLSLHAQDLIRNVVAPELPRRASLEMLEWLLGLRKEKPSAKKGQLAPEKPLRAAVRESLLTTPSNRLYHELRRALALKGFREDVDGWPSQPVTSDGYSALMQLRPSFREAIPDDALEAWQRKMWDFQKRLSDLDVDVLDAVNAIWLANARHKDDMVAVTADQLLRMRGLKPKAGGRGRGGYHDERRREVAEAVEKLAAVQLIVHEAPITREITDRRGRPRKVRESWGIQAPAMVVSSRLVQRNLPWGTEKVYAWRMRPGDFFAPYLLGPGRETALLSQKALEFDPYRQTWEKRLARYFAYQWRVRAHGGKYSQPFRVTTLLKECNPEYATKRIRWLKERLEKALNALKEHGVVADWWYEYVKGSGIRRDPATSEVLPNYEAPNARDWLNWTAVVVPPPELVRHYQELRPDKERVLPATVAPAGLGEEIHAWRRREGLTLREAARLLGIGYGYLSEIERGIKQPTPDLAARLKATITGQADR